MGCGDAAGLVAASGVIGPVAEKTCKVPPCRSSPDADAVTAVTTTTLMKLSDSQ
jgi:hypothetical protein